jgi:hypothetical protein
MISFLQLAHGGTGGIDSFLLKEDRVRIQPYLHRARDTTSVFFQMTGIVKATNGYCISFDLHKGF